MGDAVRIYTSWGSIIQLDRGNPSTGHFSRGVGNEAAILSAVAFSGHLYPQGAGGCVTAG